MPKKGTIKYEDLVFGAQEFENKTFTDRVLKKKIK